MRALWYVLTRSTYDEAIEIPIINGQAAGYADPVKAREVADHIRFVENREAQVIHVDALHMTTTTAWYDAKDQEAL